jgi:hypothetical protein
MGRARKSTKAEMEYRVNRIVRLLSNGAVRSEIIEYCAKEWGVTKASADNYIGKANKIIKADWDIDRRTFTAELLSQLASLQKECRKNGNQAHVALGCINTMAKIAHILEK